MTRRMSRPPWVCVPLIAVAVSVTLPAQTLRPAFEVASVKPQSEPMSAAAARTAGPNIRPGGVFSSSHVTVELLLAFAYDLRPYQIIGGPDWVRQDMFQIEARARTDAPVDEIKLMIGSLLEDRFGMIAHRQQREMSVEALVLARPDGRLGPELVRVDDCRAAMREFSKRPPVLSVQAVTFSGCSTGLSGLARILSLDLYLNKPVIDATALSGTFRFAVTSRPVMSEAATAATDPRYASLPVALEEQLGIKLESRRTPLDVFVIDSIQRPSGN